MTFRPRMRFRLLSLLPVAAVLLVFSAPARPAGGQPASSQAGRGSGLSLPNPVSRLFPKREAPAVAPAPRRTRPVDVADALARWPADSLPAVLRDLETGAPRADVASGAAMTLGRLLYLRGEYREAASAFSRAAARVEPARKPEARYWTGLSWLGAGEPGQARALLEEVARAPSPWQGAALVALGSAWEASERPERAEVQFAQALVAGAGERSPFALERLAAYAGIAGDLREARGAGERLVRDWPRSVEAAAARARLAAASTGAVGGSQAVLIGSYLDLGRASALANGARRAGFPDARVVSRGEGLAAVHQVWLGTYPDRARAQQAGQSAERALGVTWEIVSAR